MDPVLATDISPLFHHPKLQQATLGKIFHGDIFLFHIMDCYVFLLYGVDGEWLQRYEGVIKITCFYEVREKKRQ